MKYYQSYYTDIGTSRESNQDSVTLVKADTAFGEVLLSVICDGMGGYSEGEIASKYCVTEMNQWFKREFPKILYNDFSWDSLKNSWNTLILKMNQDLVDYARKQDIKVGSTLTAFLFFGDSYYAVHVGDSRGYEIGKEIQQITVDQTVDSLLKQIKIGGMSESKINNLKKNRKKLTESIGITPNCNMLFYTGRVKPNAIYLLCTDGFWHLLEEGDLRRYLDSSSINNNKQIRMHLNFLVEQVKQRGERDNITAIGICPYL